MFFKVMHISLEFGGEIFFFNHGSMVCWGASDGEVEKILKMVSSAQVNAYLSLTEKENMDFIFDSSQYHLFPLFFDPKSSISRHNYSDRTQTKLVKETMVIATKGKNQPEILNEKLALSNGIARSAKLGVLERKIDLYLSKTKDIPLMMKSGKTIPLSRVEVYQHIGQILNFRGYLNLHSEVI